MATKLTPEQEYLKQFPDATPYDMLMAGAITQARFDELNAGTGNSTQTAQHFKETQKGAAPEQSQSASDFRKGNQATRRGQSVQDFLASQQGAEKPGALKPSKVVTNRAQPKLITHIASDGSGIVYLTNKKTGKTTTVTEGIAAKQMRKYPHLYTRS